MRVRKRPVGGAPFAYARRVDAPLSLSVRALDRARISRDARFDGRFFIAVTSTRIYCRPVCPVRSPKRSNIRYYLTAAAAAEAGFRPCLRCRPEAAPGTPAWLGTLGAVRHGLRLIEDGFLDGHSVEDLAGRLGMGTRHLHRLFVRHVGAPPLTVAQTRRLHFAKRLIDETNLPITSVALACGFGSVRRFNDAFRRTFRRPPREVRKGRSAAMLPAAVDEVTLRCAYRPPYDWTHLHAFLAARAIPGVETIADGGYTRTVATAHGCAIVRARPLDGEDSLELCVSGAEPAALLHLAAVARRVFDLAADPATIRSAFRNDATLGPIVRRRPGLRIPGVWDAFECAVRAIAGQQVSLHAGRTLVARLVARAGQRIATPIPGLTHLFPSPAALLDADLTGLGLTDARVRTLEALARAVADGTVNFSGSVEAVTQSLTGIRGIGPWTAQYVALRALGDPDAFPCADLVLRRAACQTAATLSASELERRAEAWRPWRGYAAIHLWSAASNARAAESRR
jgi:AraC family transcriptional regulator of adaptative response / DNA-3-methyladenine glycosylase II